MSVTSTCITAALLLSCLVIFDSAQSDIDVEVVENSDNGTVVGMLFINVSSRRSFK